MTPPGGQGAFCTGHLIAVVVVVVGGGAVVVRGAVFLMGLVDFDDSAGFHFLAECASGGSLDLVGAGSRRLAGGAICGEGGGV